MVDCQYERRREYERDEILLKRYVQQGSQAAFAEIVRRHLPFVYATCLREVRNPDLAQDVAQVVFLILAERARTLRNGTLLVSWLFQTARFASQNILRKERRRMRHELQLEVHVETPDPRSDALWKQTEPLLNEALAILNAGEREAVLLRYVQELSLREVGNALGLKEDAVRMRVNRALEKMRRHLQKAGVATSVTLLAALLAESTGRTAPTLPSPLLALLKANAHGPITHALATSRSKALSQGVQHTMKWMQWKLGALATLGVVALVGGFTLVKTGAIPFYLAGRGARANVTKQRHEGLVVPTFLANLTLSDRFRLTYAVINADVRTPEQRAQEMERLKRSYDDMAQAGRMTQQQADDAFQKAAEGFNRKPTENHSIVTFSARDGKLLLRNDDITPEGAALPAVYVYDGENCLTLFRHDDLNQATVMPGPYLWNVWESLPLPGVGLTSVPLFKMDPKAVQNAPVAGKGSQTVTLSGFLPELGTMISAASDTPTPVYFSGTIRARQVAGKPQILQAQTFQEGPQKPARRMSQWDFSEHRLFQGNWIAGRIRYTQFDNNGPRRVIEFRLQEAGPEPLEQSAFEIENYLTERRTSFAYHGNDASTKNFFYDASRGTWRQQVERQREGDEQ